MTLIPQDKYLKGLKHLRFKVNPDLENHLESELC